MFKIQAKQYFDMVSVAADTVEQASSSINDLNVFPVPDGDTGSNMSMTMSGIAGLSTDCLTSIGECSKAIATCLLRGARGNSGVILSVFFRGISKALAGKDEATADDFADALANGVKGAYESVMNPTEGTILSVMKATSKKAEALRGFDLTVEDYFDALSDAANEALARTPEQLPILKAAGVVDAGGYGFCTILSAMVASIKGEKTARPIEAKSAKVAVSAAASTEIDIIYPYCTECIVEKAPEYREEGSVKELHAFVLSAGDSAVFVDDEEIIKIHVHTADPGRVLSEAVRYGEFLSVKVENMKKQHSELNDFSAEETKKKSYSKKYGFAAVLNGEGLAETFRDLGVDAIILGGQTMNPSTDDVLDAIRSIDAENVFVFPNNSNIIMVAEQAAEIESQESGRTVKVIPTRSIPQGITSLYAFDETAEPSENASAMMEARENVISLSTTYAVRDASIDGLQIRKGEYLGLVENKVKFSAPSLLDCVKRLAQELVDSCCVTVFTGADMNEETAEQVQALLSEQLDSSIDIVMLPGGQPVYSLIIAGD
ncbi:MAG: DAK2 domain-containing protein [Clostridia bacterium]|nr:DAK2 domain-containing protein [Clostridia bacterium]